MTDRYRANGYVSWSGDGRVGELLAGTRHVLGPGAAIPVAEFESSGRVGIPAGRNRRRRGCGRGCGGGCCRCCRGGRCGGCCRGCGPDGLGCRLVRGCPCCCARRLHTGRLGSGRGRLGRDRPTRRLADRLGCLLGLFFGLGGHFLGRRLGLGRQDECRGRGVVLVVFHIGGVGRLRRLGGSILVAVRKAVTSPPVGTMATTDQPSADLAVSLVARADGS